MLHGLFLGCDYPGEAHALPDCALDANNWAERLEPYLASGKVLTNEKATRKGMTRAVKALAGICGPNDTVVVVFSGHGTTSTLNGKTVQGIVANDGEVIYEFERAKLLQLFSQAIYIGDCCFAGGLARGRKKQARWIPSSHVFLHDAEPPKGAIPKPAALYAACRAGETADSTGTGGAMSLACFEAIDGSGPRTTLASMAKRIRQLLPSAEHQQHPQFYCSNKAFAARTLKSFKGTA